MNHIFKVIFDKSKGIFIAVSELTTSHGKEKSEKQGGDQLVNVSSQGGGI